MYQNQNGISSCFSNQKSNQKISIELVPCGLSTAPVGLLPVGFRYINLGVPASPGRHLRGERGHLIP